MLLPARDRARGSHHILRKGVWEMRDGPVSQGLSDLYRETWECSILNPDHPFNQERMKNPPDFG